jgi:hypothetical protein
VRRLYVLRPINLPEQPLDAAYSDPNGLSEAVNRSGYLTRSPWYGACRKFVGVVGDLG